MRRRDKRRRLKKASAGNNILVETRTPAESDGRNPQDGDRHTESRRPGSGVTTGLADRRGQNQQVRDPPARKATGS